MTTNNLFKYFADEAYLDSFIQKGEVFFNTLAYFSSCKNDTVRLDRLEGYNVYKPDEGIRITPTETQASFLYNGAFLSRIKNLHRIYVFCASTELSETLFQKFGSIGCVEITYPEEFKKRIIKKIMSPAHNIKNKVLLAGKVVYYAAQPNPDSRYACPEQIIMSKTDNFSHEKEYRFAFTKDKNGFELRNIEYSLTNKCIPTQEIGRGKKLILGNLSDIVRIIT